MEVELTGTAGAVEGIVAAVASAVGADPDRDEVLRAAVDLIVERTPIALAWVGEVRGRDEDIEVVAWAGSGWAYLDNATVVSTVAAVEAVADLVSRACDRLAPT